MPKYKVTAFLDQNKTLTNGQHPIYIRINRGNNRSLIRLKDLTGTISHWDNKTGLFVARKSLNTNYRQDNDTIKQELVKITKIIDHLQEEKINWTFAMVKKRYDNTFESRRYFDYLQERIKELNKNEQFSTAGTKTKLIPLLNAYKPQWKTYHFADIDTEFIEGFIKFLKTKKAYADTSISHYTRAIKADLNLAIKRGFGSPETYPFSYKYHYNDIIKTEKLNTEVINKHIGKDTLVKFKEHHFECDKQKYIQAVFFFTFFAQGINFKDLALLKNDNIISNGETTKSIQYVRAKTGKLVSFPLIEPLKKYMKWLRDYKRPIGDYLLPIITKDHSGKKLHTHINNRGNFYNSKLKELANLIDFPEALLDLTSYYARHSFAQISKENGVSIERISDMMGHDSIKTTNIYLGKLNANANAKANASLLD